ncbi:uncharacterized protein YyaL (SSP411 family) [Arthrobacter silviterrae]|uniref:Thioredoxin domain-containing protein n=1 Tax=Arthrobacter silviterrae TaxID=2026658 RepID=A0ABX0D8U6_9MICC|nr:thioredoxin domain-containing protein [Arthrobacter silviterrae]MDQ0279183.1 uncharacterized protein YyaL (SSP411 family) [Arthrobacter silviterrae]NGN83302.1 thioredoxin domain-containing protein [Arthrobacter silviterrae]
MNRLAGEPSAYLRQHAGNPVDWQPFDDAAFAEARERQVPVFLSVGYAACHWCHVMAGESFEDPEVGEYLRRHFVAIKVDREERPDVDDAYMAATQALTGQGGWPMSVFLTPDGRAFFAGTYFPPQPVSGRPSFKQVLAAVVEAWADRRTEVLATADALAAALADPAWRVRTDSDVADSPAPPVPVQGLDGARNGFSVHREAASLAVAAMARAEDTTHGGFGTAPKFPPTPALEFLIRHAASGGGGTVRGEAAGSPDVAAGLAGRTLGAMVNSALFDQVGGGFARYSVTADWSLPHYEKMLYDNAGLLLALVHWVRLAEARPGQIPAEVPGPDAAPDAGPGVQHIHSTELPLPLSAAEARGAVHKTVGWLLAELRLPGGAFASSLDADTVIDGVHHEGASYQWTLAQLREAAELSAAADPAPAEPQEPADLAAAVARFMNIPAKGAAPLHPGRGLTPPERAAWDALLPGLRTMRAARTMPGRDDKVVAAWNGMLLGALAEAAMVLGEPAWLAAAVELGGYLREVHWDGGVLRRVSHAGRARGIEGLLEDYAACADGYFALYAATGSAEWFALGEALLDSAQRFLADGTVFNSPGGASGGLAGAPAGARFADPFDNATASPVALLAGALATHAAYTGSVDHRVLSENLLGSLPELARRAPRSAGGLLSVAEAVAAGPVETAIVGLPGPEREALERRAWASPSPGMVVAVWDGAGPPPVPLLEGRGTAPGASPLAYVCHNMACARPVATAAELDTLIP